MPAWKTQYEGVEAMTLAVMGCVVNGPGESKAANIGISLPGTGEAPNCPVYIDGRTIRPCAAPTTNLRPPFASSSTTTSRRVLEEAVVQEVQEVHRGSRGSGLDSLERADSARPHHQQYSTADDEADRQAPPETHHASPEAEAEE